MKGFSRFLLKISVRSVGFLAVRHRSLTLLPIQLEAPLDDIILQIHTALHTGHGLHEFWPVLLRQALVAAEAGELTHMADVGGGVILCGRCPAIDDVPDAAQLILSGIGAQQAEGSAQAPLHTFKFTKALPTGSREGVFSFP